MAKLSINIVVLFSSAMLIVSAQKNAFLENTVKVSYIIGKYFHNNSSVTEYIYEFRIKSQWTNITLNNHNK